jgi:hypothetical protein
MIEVVFNNLIDKSVAIIRINAPYEMKLVVRPSSETVAKAHTHNPHMLDKSHSCYR